MTTKEVIDTLIKEGYIVNYEYVKYLIRNFCIEAPLKSYRNSYMWSDENIKQLKWELIRRFKFKNDVGVEGS